MSCSVPQAIAPELAGWADEESMLCYWIWRAEGAEEVERAIRIIRRQEKSGMTA